MAAKSMTASTIPVMYGVVSKTLLNKANSRNEIFCSQMLRNILGTRRLSHLGFLSGGASTAPRCSHSPGNGIGHTAHHPRPKKGTATRMRIAHQAIHTNTMLKL